MAVCFLIDIECCSKFILLLNKTSSVPTRHLCREWLSLWNIDLRESQISQWGSSFYNTKHETKSMLKLFLLINVILKIHYNVVLKKQTNRQINKKLLLWVFSKKSCYSLERWIYRLTIGLPLHFYKPHISVKLFFFFQHFNVVCYHQWDWKRTYTTCRQHEIQLPVKRKKGEGFINHSWLFF